MTSEWVLLVHLGPVQDFIASARRCRDLWYGSRLLSQLAACSTRAMLEAAGQPDDSQALIFPGALEDQGSIANKIQLNLNASAEDVRRIAEAGRKAMYDELRGLSEEVFQQVARAARQSEDLNLARARQQIERLMEYMWAAVPVRAHYADARAEAERTLAARKNSRSWPPSDGEDAGIPKSSLDGVRASVIHERVYDRESPTALRRTFGISGQERLCGVGLLKRNGKDPTARDDVDIFHSAGHIASAGVRARIEAHHDIPRVQQLWAEYLSALEQHDALEDQRVRCGGARTWTHAERTYQRVMPRPGRDWADPGEVGLDGGLLYPQRLDSLVDADAAAQLRRPLEALLAAVGCREPYPYYAVLLADGDRMGIALNALTEPAQHKAFSKHLEQAFAARAGAIVEAHGGSLIYSGGDDVLALVPLHGALACARELKDQFHNALAETFAGTGIAVPTLSVGLAVVHFLEPFANARALARQAEAAAKHSAGRNALAVLLKKRSGTPKLTYGRWSAPGAPIAGDLDQRLLRWAALQRKAQLPRGFAYQIEDIERLLAQGATHHAIDPELVSALVRRVISRRDVSPALAGEFEALFQEYLKISKHPLEAVQRFSDEFQIAAEFRKATDELVDADHGVSP